MILILFINIIREVQRFNVITSNEKMQIENQNESSQSLMMTQFQLVNDLLKNKIGIHLSEQQISKLRIEHNFFAQNVEHVWAY